MIALTWPNANGESQPRAYARGDTLPAGAFNAGKGALRVQARADFYGSALAELVTRSARREHCARCTGGRLGLVPRLYGTKLHSTSAANSHFYLATVGILLYAASMWTSGITQGVMWRAENTSGGLMYPSFVETLLAIRAMYWTRLIGGTLHLVGFIMMAWNLLRTARSGQAVDGSVRSPLLNINRACQTCHRFGEAELAARVDAIQTRNHDLLERGGAAINSLLDALVAAKAAGATPEQLEEALQLQRRGQWRLDFIAAENRMGFHAPQEAARVLAEAIDYARQGQVAALQAAAAKTAPAPSTGP